MKKDENVNNYHLTVKEYLNRKGTKKQWIEYIKKEIEHIDKELESNSKYMHRKRMQVLKLKQLLKTIGRRD